MDVATFRRMQAVASDAWQDEVRPLPHHVGILAWRRFQHVGREAEWRVRLWERGGRDVAWAWRDLPRSLLDYCIRWDHRADLSGAILDWFEHEETGDRPAVRLHTGDDAMARELERRGYRPDEAAVKLALHFRALGGEPMPEPPTGFRLRTVGPDDVEQRVEVHRAAFAPSRVTVESYRQVQAAWPYRADLDCVVEQRGGRLVAYCLAWLDEANRVGELEPVGVHPDFHRRGLGSAVCRFALRRLEQGEATRAMVYAVADNPQNSGPKAMYESIGFAELSRSLRYVHDR